ncbi:Hypothetical predicted protein [Octopus vulgaris]|uniref:Uncharacterized protein n=1 Tax=Octopus vulgaris TaxID=6645 RepID=A0AA36F5D1_OCTVU|nr:Hypothetical predicted protein [Octopus vulgaris]
MIVVIRIPEESTETYEINRVNPIKIQCFDENIGNMELYIFNESTSEIVKVIVSKYARELMVSFWKQPYILYKEIFDFGKILKSEH